MFEIMWEVSKSRSTCGAMLHAPGGGCHPPRKKVMRRLPTAASTGLSAQTVVHFERHAETELAQLHQQICDGTYRPQPVGAQARKSRATPAGYISGARPGSASRFAARVGNYLRAGVFPTPMPILRLGIVALIGFAMTGVSRYG